MNDINAIMNDKVSLESFPIRWAKLGNSFAKIRN